MADDHEQVSSLGAWIRRRREALGLTHIAVAHCVGCAAVTIRNLEANVRRPARHIALRLARCLDLPPNVRDLFLQVARGELPISRLPAPRTGLDVAPPLPTGEPPDAEGGSLGSWLRHRREALGLSQADLARCVDCPDVTIRNLETDVARPSRQIAERLARCLAIPPDELDRFLQLARGDLSVPPVPAPRTDLDASPPLPTGEPPDAEGGSLGAWLRRRREALGLSHADLARCVDCADVTIRNLEADVEPLRRRIALRLARCLAIPPNELDRFLQVAAGQRPVAHLLAPHAGLDTSRPRPRQESSPGGGVPTDPAIHVVRIPQAPAPVILSGQVRDAHGQGLAQQSVHLRAARGSVSVFQTTDATGAFRVEVPPGTYHIDLSGSLRTSTWQTASGRYRLSTDARHLAPLTVRENTTLDLVLPFKRLMVHVEDSLGLPVAGAQIETHRLKIDQLSLGILSVSGSSFYVAPETVTNAAGDVVLWLFPTPPGQSYTLTVTPPAGIPFAIFRVPNITVTSDTSTIIILQYDAGGSGP
ncbi:MAG TPA: helix-turn-helix domain-containing protein [Herpetosiphonaceae bacterium]